MGWPVGRNLGSEPDLYTRYEVSRDIFREAVRRVERDGFAIMRRGIGGGLIVTAPAEDGVINVLTNYLEIVDIDINEIIETQDILEHLVIRLATERLDDTGIDALNQFREGLDIERSSIHQLSEWLLQLQGELARQTKNASIVLFLEPLVNFTIDYFDLSSMPKALYRNLNIKGSDILVKIVNAIIARNVSAATAESDELIKLMRQEVFSTPTSGAARRVKRRSDTAPLRHQLRRKRDNKTAEALALRISSYIRQKRLKPGDRLGSEPDLLIQFDTCRSTFREALRMLESVSRVVTKRGKGGGLSVEEPDPQSTIDVTTTYLQYIKFDLVQLLEVRLVLECFAAELAAQRTTPEEKEALTQALDREQLCSVKEFATAANEMRRCIVLGAHNRVLYLYCEILNELVLREFARGPRWKGWDKAKTAASMSHRAVVQAIIDGDGALAHRRMYEHRKNADENMYSR